MYVWPIVVRIHVYTYTANEWPLRLSETQTIWSVCACWQRRLSNNTGEHSEREEDLHHTAHRQFYPGKLAIRVELQSSLHSTNWLHAINWLLIRWTVGARLNSSVFRSSVVHGLHTAVCRWVLCPLHSSCMADCVIRPCCSAIWALSERIQRTVDCPNANASRAVENNYSMSRGFSFFCSLIAGSTIQFQSHGRIGKMTAHNVRFFAWFTRY